MPAKVPAKRPTMRQLNDARNSQRRGEMELAIAEGRLRVRQMTPKERQVSDAQRSAHNQARVAGAASRGQ